MYDATSLEQMFSIMSLVKKIIVDNPDIKRPATVSTTMANGVKPKACKKKIYICNFVKLKAFILKTKSYAEVTVYKVKRIN